MDAAAFWAALPWAVPVPLAAAAATVAAHPAATAAAADGSAAPVPAQRFECRLALVPTHGADATPLVLVDSASRQPVTEWVRRACRPPTQCRPLPGS